MGRKAILFVSLVVFLVGWVAALVLLMRYLKDSFSIEIMIFGGLVLVAPLALLVGAVIAARGVRKEFHQHSTRLRNSEQRISDFQSPLQSVRGQVAGWASRLGQQSSRLDRLNERISEIDKWLKKRTKTSDISKMAIENSLYEIQKLSFKVAASQRTPLNGLLSREESSNYLRMAATREDYLEALPVIRVLPEAINSLTLTQGRILMKGMRQLGYLEETATLMALIAAKSGKRSDVEKADIFKSEFDLFSGKNYPKINLPAFEGHRDGKTVLHFVGKALPETQTGYTLRTHYTVEAQQRMGINPIVVAQSGASPRAHEQTETYSHKGIRYYLLGGPQRNTVPWNQWLIANIEGLAKVVREVRPSILHAHSDFLNAIIAQTVGDIYGIPVVNETRGFWEESWLSRKSTAEEWEDLGQIEKFYGLPTAYTLRKEREAEYRSRADVVVTLADVMKNHIEALSAEYGQSVEKIVIVPNAVESEAFPVAPRAVALLEEIGIPHEATVIGYISSIVEYEGIDILIQAFFELASALGIPGVDISDSLKVEQGIENRESVNSSTIFESLSEQMARVHPTPSASSVDERTAELLAETNAVTNRQVHLLIVGDGAERANLEKLASELGISALVTFTGRVPHERVLDYYSIIDLFVVPRRPTKVTELVTPLKPFEAMSTGRPCVFSNVGALAEIANQSGAAATFAAGDHHNLALTLARLLKNPEELARMSEQGAAWVRNVRTWDSNAAKYLEIYNSLGLNVNTPGWVRISQELEHEEAEAEDA